MSQAALHRGLPRASRGAFVAALTLTLSAGAHVTAGGSAPDGATVAVLGVVFTAVCWLMSRSRWDTRQLVAVFLLAQSAVHLSASLHEGAAHAMGPSMVLTHALAVVVLVAAVTRGERTLIALLDLLSLRITTLRAIPVPVIEHRAGASWPTPLRGIQVWSDALGRAPPVVTA